MSTPRHAKRPSSLQPPCGPISPCCRMHTHAAYKPFFLSLVRRMIATLIKCVAEKASAHSEGVFSVTCSPDGTKIASGSTDGTIKVWDFGAPRELKIAPPWPKLTPSGLSGRQTGAVEREDKRPQRHRQVGGVFPRRIEDRVGIVGQDDHQSLGFGCAGVLKVDPLLGQN